MTLEEAIGVLETINAKTDHFLITDDARAEAIDMAISALQAQDLQQTCNKLATDTISRQAAIDALLHNQEIYSNNFGDDPIYRYTTAIINNDVQAIANMPSAQPENIRCYECKHGTHSGCGAVYICNVSPELVMEHTGDFYCGYAERRTDG